MITTSVKRLGKSTARMRVTVSADEVGKAISDANLRSGRLLGAALGQKAIPSAGKGQDDALRAATTAITTSACKAAVAKERLRIVSNPRISLDSLAADGQPFSFDVELRLVPEMTLSSHRDITVPVSRVKIAAADVETSIERVRQKKAVLQSAADRLIAFGDVVVISFTSTIDGESYEGNTVENLTYDVGEGVLPAGFDEGLLGLQAGARKAIEFRIPGDFPNPELAGKHARFDVEIHDVKVRNFPELTEALAAELGFASLDDWRKAAEKELLEQAAQQSELDHEAGARSQLADRLQGEVPTGLIDSQAQRMLSQFAEDLRGQGVTLHDYCDFIGVDETQVLEEMKSEAKQLVRENLALEALFRKLRFEITDDDMLATMKQLGIDTESGMPLDLEYELLDDEKRAALHEMTMHRKATEWLLANSRVVEVSADAND